MPESLSRSDALGLHLTTLSRSTCGEKHLVSADTESAALRRDSPASPNAVKRVVKDYVGTRVSR